MISLRRNVQLFIVGKFLSLLRPEVVNEEYPLFVIFI